MLHFLVIGYNSILCNNNVDSPARRWWFKSPHSAGKQGLDGLGGRGQAETAEHEELKALYDPRYRSTIGRVTFARTSEMCGISTSLTTQDPLWYSSHFYFVIC